MTNEMRERIDPGFGKFAADNLLSLILKLQHETTGARTSDDIEYIHQSRVFSRRLRAALKIFSPCLPEKQVKNWEREIKKITRALGEARDIDVQIGFIRSYFEKHANDVLDKEILFYPSGLSSTRITAALSDPAYKKDLLEKDTISGTIGFFVQNLNEKKERDEIISSGYIQVHPIRIGLECLVLRLNNQRRLLQPGIIKIINQFEKSDIVGSMTTWLHEIKVKAMLEDTEIFSLYGYEQAFYHIMLCIQELFWYESSLSDPNLIEQHHKMRIAAKKFRYTLEIFADLFDDHLKPEIKTFKKIQDTIGDMHDCDVWIQILPDVIISEKAASIRYFGNENFFTLIEPGLQAMLLDIKQDRECLFSSLQSLWQSIKDEGFWDRLEEKVSAPVQGGFVPDLYPCNEGPVKIALISDIHANLPALEAVLTDARNRGVCALLNAGDSIGYGAFPDEVISLIRDSHVLSIMGNYDRSVLSKKWKKKKLKSHDKQIAMRYAYKNIKPENRAYLAGLPDHIRLKVRDKSILITHGSPDSQNEYLVKDTPISRFSEIAKDARADIIITGHTHLPLILETDGVWFINCGSVGRTEDGDPRACYALLTLDPFSVVHIRVPYDINRAIEAIRARHLPDSFVRVISEGKPLDVVEEDMEHN